MTARLVFLVLLLPLEPALARVGETMAQLDARWGHSVFIAGSVPDTYCEVRYGYSGFLVTVDFSMRICKVEFFERPDKAALSDNEIKEILAVSAEKGQTWKKLPSKPGSPDWKRSDERAEAFLADDRKFLFVKDPNWNEPL